MPNLSRRGLESMPSLVVAPINVKCLSAMRKLDAIAPVPVTRSREKSSIAGYKISSMLRFKR